MSAALRAVADGALFDGAPRQAFGTPDGPVGIPWITVGELLARRARATPGDVALRFPDTGARLTYAELSEASGRVAAGLAGLGAVKGTRVATMTLNRLEQLLTWLACARLGAWFTPLNAALAAHDLAHVLREVEPGVALVDAERLPTYREAVALAGIADVVLVGAGTGDVPDVVAFERLASAADAPPIVDVRPSDPVALMPTGGTTGLPKAVVRPHFSCVCGALRYQAMFEPRAGDVHLATGQLFHSGAQEGAFLGPLMAGIPSVWTERFSTSAFWSRVREARATVTDLSGAALTFLLEQEPRAEDAENPLRAALCAAHGVEAAARDRFRARFAIPHLLEIYAMTETGMLLFSNTVSDAKPGTVGRTRGWCDVMIADDEDRALPPGETGQILLRPTLAASMADGYFRRPEATLSAFRNLWLHTGDLGSLDADGWLTFAGRAAGRIRRRGENVSALEVEQVLLELPAVRECAVVGVPAAVGDDDIKAVLVPRPGAALDPRDVIAHCLARLAAFKVPRYVQVSSGPLPRSAAKGEVERHMLGDVDAAVVWDREAAVDAR